MKMWQGRIQQNAIDELCKRSVCFKEFVKRVDRTGAVVTREEVRAEIEKAREELSGRQSLAE